MNRRELLRAAAVLVAGATVLPPGWAMDHEQHAFLAARGRYIDSRPLDFFSTAQRAAVTAMAEQVIPATDTPGAIDAGVPRFIELMVADWFNESERALFMDGLVELMRRAGADYAELPAAQQLALLEALEEEAADAAWFEIGNTLRVWDDTAPFICQFKELCVLGFFLSETGSTQVLRLNPMGEFNGSVPLAPLDPALASQLPMRRVEGV